jgi:hypothetical protein
MKLQAKSRLMAKGPSMDIHVKEGGFHEWLGKDKDDPITDADIARGKAAGGHAAEMAQFAENAREWKHK